MRLKTQATKQGDVEDKWYIVDAKGARIGVVASKIAELLLGKRDRLVKKYNDPRAFVVVVNAASMDIPPKRMMTKFYKNFSGFPGGLRFTNIADAMKKDPTFPLQNAVKGMLPKNTRGRTALARLKLYTGEEHPHEAQNPTKIDINTVVA